MKQHSFDGLYKHSLPSPNPYINLYTQKQGGVRWYCRFPHQDRTIL